MHTLHIDDLNHVKTGDDLHDDVYSAPSMYSNQVNHQTHHHHSSKSKHHRFSHSQSKSRSSSDEAMHTSDGRVYPYKVETFQHFGTVTCNAQNAIGQSGPCIYQIMTADIPDAVRNCTSFNVTANSVQISCIPGKDGGIQQYFHVEIIDEQRRIMLYNTSFKSADFVLKRLPSDSMFRIKVMSYNLQGSSAPFKLRIKTLPAPLLRTGTCTISDDDGVAGAGGACKRELGTNGFHNTLCNVASFIIY